MAYYNERRTVEAMVFPFAFIAVVKDGIPDEFAATRDEMVKLFEAAAEEVYPAVFKNERSNLPDVIRKRNALYNRIKDVILNCITCPARNHEYPAAKAGLALYYFINNMIEQGAYYIAPESNFGKALELFLPAVQPWVEEERFDKSAFKEARRMLTRMHERNYFTDVVWESEFEKAA